MRETELRLALAIIGGFHESARGFAIQMDADTAATLREFIGNEVLVVPRDGEAGDVGTVHLLGVDLGDGEAASVRFDGGRRLGNFADFADRLRGPLTLKFISDVNYDAMIAAAAGPFVQPASTPKEDIAEVTAAFGHTAEPPIAGILAVLRRETGNLCALTGAPLMPDALPIAIRLAGNDCLHVNNLLLLSPAAEAAFRDGHFSVRDDFSVIVDLRYIDPELLEMINPNGRLILPANPAIRPAPENLAWHRRHVFRLD